jgi:hypothetical protein
MVLSPVAGCVWELGVSGTAFVGAVLNIGVALVGCCGAFEVNGTAPDGKFKLPPPYVGAGVAVTGVETGVTVVGVTIGTGVGGGAVADPYT